MATRRSRNASRQLRADPFQAPGTPAISPGANPLAGVADQAGKLGLQLGVSEAKRQAVVAKGEGQLAGTDPGFQRREGNKLTDRIFNDAGTQIYLAEESKRTRVKLQELELQHSADPVAFEAASRGYAEGVLSQADSELAPFLKSDIEFQSGLAANRVAGRNKANVNLQRAVSIRGELEDLRKQIGQSANAAAGDGVELEGARLIAEKYNAFLAMAQGGDTPVFTAAQEAQLREDATVELSREFVLGGFRVQPTIEEKEAYITRFNEKNKDFSETEKRRLSSQMSAVTRGARAATSSADRAAALEFKAAHDQAADTVASVVSRLADGLPVPESELRARHDEVVASGFTDLDLELFRAERNAHAVGEFTKMSSAEMDSVIAAQAPVDELGQAHVRRLQQIREKQLAARRRDPMSAAVDSGLVEPIQLDPTDPASWKEVMGNVRRIQSAWGVGDVSPLTNTQASALSQWYKDQDSTQQFGALAAIFNGAGESSTRAIVNQLDSNGLTLAAGALEVFSEGPDYEASSTVALMVVEGPFRAEQSRLAMGKQSEMDEAFQQFAGGVFEANGGDFSAALAATTAHYQTNAVLQGWNSWSPDQFAQSVRAVVGEPVAWSNEGWGGPRDSQILAPRGWSGADVSNFMDELTPAQVQKMGIPAGFAVEDLPSLIEQIQSRARLVTEDRGRVRVEMPGPLGRRGFLVSSEDTTEPFLLDLNLFSPPQASQPFLSGLSRAVTGLPGR